MLKNSDTLYDINSGLPYSIDDQFLKILCYLYRRKICSLNNKNKNDFDPLIFKDDNINKVLNQFQIQNTPTTSKTPITTTTTIRIRREYYNDIDDSLGLNTNSDKDDDCSDYNTCEELILNEIGLDNLIVKEEKMIEKEAAALLNCVCDCENYDTPINSPKKILDNL